MDQFLSEIRIMPYTFAPSGWAWCEGQLLAISQNTALFSLLGTTYGGDGKVTFALPDLRGSVPIGFGQSSGGSYYDRGQQAGESTVTLLYSDMPVHTHGYQVSTRSASERQPPGQMFATGVGVGVYNNYTEPQTFLAPQALSVAGGGQPHNNLMPGLVLRFCIALQGIYPARP